MYKARYCPYCKQHKTNENAAWLRYAFYFHNGYMTDDEIKCSECGTTLVKMNLTVEEFDTIIDISGDPSFIEAMDELKQKDPIEFNLKLAQFKTQIGQQQNANTDQLKCPTCSSTNVQRISSTAKVAGVVAFGIFSKTAKSQFKCGNCGYKF